MFKKSLMLCFAAALAFAPVGHARDNQTLRVGVGVDARNMDPQNTVDAFSYSMQRQMYESLCTVDGKTKQLVPMLAESWEMLDEQTYKFHLKKNVKFHNGEPFTAKDVVFSLKRATSPDSVFASAYGKYINPEGFEIIDDHTVIVRTNGPVGGFLESMKHPYAYILNEKAVTDAGKDYFRQPVGTGPYKFVKWVKGEALDLQAFPEYHGEKPKFPEIRFVVLPDDSSRMIALETDKVDMIYSVPYNEFDRLKKEDKVNVVEADGLVLLHLGFNQRSPKLADPRVRLAIEYAINKQAYNKVVYNGHATDPLGPLPTASTFFPKDPKPYGYDLEKAKALLKEAGVKDLKLSLWVINARDRISGATLLQAMLSQVGITLDIQVMENAIFDERLRDAKHDMYLGTWGMQTARDAGTFWQSLFTIKAVGATNKTFTDDAQLDADIQKAIATVDQDARNAIFQKVWDRVNELHPMAYLSIANYLYAGQKGLVGLEDFHDGIINYLGNVHYKN